MCGSMYIMEVMWEALHCGLVIYHASGKEPSSLHIVLSRSELLLFLSFGWSALPRNLQQCVHHCVPLPPRPLLHLLPMPPAQPVRTSGARSPTLVLWWLQLPAWQRWAAACALVW